MIVCTKYYYLAEQYFMFTFFIFWKFRYRRWVFTFLDCSEYTLSSWNQCEHILIKQKQSYNLTWPNLRVTVVCRHIPHQNLHLAILILCSSSSRPHYIILFVFYRYFYFNCTWFISKRVMRIILCKIYRYLKMFIWSNMWVRRPSLIVKNIHSLDEDRRMGTISKMLENYKIL